MAMDFGISIVPGYIASLPQEIFLLTRAVRWMRGWRL